MTIRIGIIGSGNMATQRVVHFAGCSGATVAAVASKNEASGRALADHVESGMPEQQLVHRKGLMFRPPHLSDMAYEFVVTDERVAGLKVIH